MLAALGGRGQAVELEKEKTLRERKVFAQQAVPFESTRAGRQQRFLLGKSNAMDIGGAKMAGFASGLIDSFQYFGGSLAGYFLGLLLDKSWGSYFYFMAPFGLIGGFLMVSIIGKVTLAKPARQSAT